MTANMRWVAYFAVAISAGVLGEVRGVESAASVSFDAGVASVELEGQCPGKCTCVLELEQESGEDDCGGLDCNFSFDAEITVVEDSDSGCCPHLQGCSEGDCKTPHVNYRIKFKGSCFPIRHSVELAEGGTEVTFPVDDEWFEFEDRGKSGACGAENFARQDVSVVYGACEIVWVHSVWTCKKCMAPPPEAR